MEPEIYEIEIHSKGEYATRNEFKLQVALTQLQFEQIIGTISNLVFNGEK